ncbi:MazG nucleotide pyrophosphohydrolase domain-containing protein [Streptomyces sp. NPDC045431]|uniref:MazG nucleotide pyrophosphohydrolase domain-containing protein n=1 Tax=Streptomyces sp. NPDC045431 TaxID=3155613 RepID=UPI0033FBCBE5
MPDPAQLDFQGAVAQFHEAFDVVNDIVTPEKFRELLERRVTLISEEAKEVAEAIDAVHHAIGNTDYTGYPVGLVEHLAKELADLLYVIFGTADLLGIPLDKAFAEVHESNMSKLGEDGQPVLREDGKVLKGPNYREADMTEVGIDSLTHYLGLQVAV